MADDDPNLVLTPRASSSAPAHVPFDEQQDTLREDLAGLVVQTTTNGSHHMTTNGDDGDATTLLSDLKNHIDKTMAELMDQWRRDFDKVLMVLQQESAKRTALEGRLHSQLLLQSEAMVAMEMKLLRLEAKVERREKQQQQNGGGVRSRPTFRTIDEEERGSDARSNNNEHQRTTEVTNIAVITGTSGASLTSGVTATSLDDDRSEGAHGDVEDEGGIHQDVSHDGSDSTPTQGSRPHFGAGTLESILMNPKFGEHSVHGNPLVPLVEMPTATRVLPPA